MSSRLTSGEGSSRSSTTSAQMEVGEEVVLFSAPSPSGHIAVTQCLVKGYGPKAVRKGDVDTLNNDPDYDSDDVVDAAESTVLRRLRFYRRSGSGSDKGASGEGGGAAAGAGGGEVTSDGDVDMGAEGAKAAGKGAGAGAGAGGGADASEGGGEPFSDYVQTEMLCHIHLPPAALASSTCEAILNRSVLVRSQLQLSYHRLFVACASLTHFPGYFFAYHHHRHPNRAPLEDEELMEDRVVLVVGLGGAALPQYFLSLTRKRRMTVEIVERDEGVIAVARKFFGVRESPKLRIHRDDAATFVPEAAVAGVLYDMIFFDVDDLTPDKTGVMAPPLNMCSVQFLSLVVGLLDEGGVAVFNVLYANAADGRDEQFLADFVYNCCQVFSGVVVLLSVDGAENRVVACWNYPLPDAQKLNVDGRRLTETLSGPDLTHRLKRLVRNRPMLKQLMQRTRIGLLPLTEVLSRRSTAAAGDGAAK